MKMTVQELAEIVNGRVVGDGETRIERIADLDNADQNEIAYLENEKLVSLATESKASCLIVKEGLPEKLPERTLIEVRNPKLAFSLIGAALHPPVRRQPSIDATAAVAGTADISLTAYVGPHVCIGEYASVGPYTRLEAGVVLGASVTVGEDCVLHPNVVLYDGVSIGSRVILHAGVCIG
ncbi:MAG TPA: LpxD N-terminal domain-containing protein, partial [Pyrinomonadaceae bacterium]|nr:LpxD N-terminal domain-containing protein [Pyrinomonadaceae bacterium]